jgi:ankyrin repeat protein
MEGTVKKPALACRTGDLTALKRMVAIDEKSIQSRDDRGWQPLHHAAYHGHADCIRFLTSLDSCEVNCLTDRGETPLVLAC